MADQEQNPGRKWRKVENDGDGNRYFESFRFTPHTTDMEFYRDPKIYETSDVTRSTHNSSRPDPHHDSDSGRGPRGNHRPDERIREEIHELLSEFQQMGLAGIQVVVHDGVVTVAGEVSSPNEKDTVQKIVENVIGVVGINNELKIKQ